MTAGEDARDSIFRMRTNKNCGVEMIDSATDYSIDPKNQFGPEERHDRIEFFLNGKQTSIGDVDPRTSLLDFLRSTHQQKTGTKLSCGEGGCGACTVVLAHLDPGTGDIVERPVNACLRPLVTIDGMAVTTIEGIGSSRKLNPIQQRIVEFSGSQCGFCTPGFVMTMYAMLRRNRAPTAADVENQFDGNLCRCTGFRSILNAMQSLVGDADSLASATGLPIDGNSLRAARGRTFSGGGVVWHTVTTIAEALSLMVRYSGRAKLVNGNTSTGIYKAARGAPGVYVDISRVGELTHWVRQGADGDLEIGAGVSFAGLLDVLDRILVEEAGNRSLSVLRDHVRKIAGHQVRSVATVGGTIMLVLKHVAEGVPFPSDFLTVLAALGGRVTYRRPEFPARNETADALALPAADAFPNGWLITSVTIPRHGADVRVATFKVARRIQNAHAIVNAGFRVVLDVDRRVTECRFVFGGLATIAWSATNTQAAVIGQVWSDAVMQTALRILANEARDALAPMPEEGISDAYRISLVCNLFHKFALQVLAETPDDLDARTVSGSRPYERPVSHGRHGSILAPYAELGARVADTARVAVLASARFSVAEVRSTSSGKSEPEAKAIANFLLSNDQSSVPPTPSTPLPKLGANLQVSGEAKFTQDIIVPDALASQYVYSRANLARFRYLDDLPDMKRCMKEMHPGFIDYITFCDIPQPAKSNTYDEADPASYDPVFANGIVTSYGQPVGLVVAETILAAQRAADAIEGRIVYDTAGLPPALLSIDEARAAGRLLKGHGSLEAVKRPGSDDAWLAHPVEEPGKVLVRGRQETGAQAHFYMETQTALAVPEEGGRMTLYCSSQHLGTCQEVAATALKIPVALVAAKALRLGGGFGGKEVRPPYFAVAAAVAAWSLGRPVRVALDRNTDMAMVGKRHPFRGEFAVSADAQGKIDKMSIDFAADAGSSYDCTLPVTDLVLLTADAAYGVPTFKATRSACMTNRQTNTAMRSFGVIQGTLIVEEAVEKVAHTLGLPPETVRERNFYRDATPDDFDVTPYGQGLIDCRINQVWGDFKSTIDFDARARSVAEFNAANRWRKRGISMIPIKYGISYTYMPMNQGAAYVMIFAEDASVLVKHGGVEMGQGIHTKIAQLAADALGIDASRIQVSGTDTLDIPNSPSTGASTGTDLNGGAVQAACADLKRRLETFCESGGAKIPADWRTNWQKRWPDIVNAAFSARINLSAQSLFASSELAALDKNGQLPNKTDRLFYYFTYSAGASEVEIDVLTGEVTILRSDIVYDCGKTINAPIDYGQIEGGFVQGLGNVTTEQIYFAEDGRLISDGTWTYKIPCSKTIPIEFNVYLLDYQAMPGAKTPLDTYGIRSAKSTGEPPLVLASSAFFAIKHAIMAARREAGSNDWFELPSPATVERIQAACLVPEMDGIFLARPTS